MISLVWKSDRARITEGGRWLTIRFQACNVKNEHSSAFLPHTKCSLLIFPSIGLPALRTAGGLVMAASTWSLLNGPERTEVRSDTKGGAQRRATGPIAFVVPFQKGFP